MTHATTMISPDKRTFIASVFASIALIASRHDFVLAFSNAKTARHRPTYVSLSLETTRALTPRSDDANGSISDISNAISTDRRAILKSALVAATALVAADRPALAGIQPAVCDPDVFVLRKGNRVVNIIGTVHISSVSADLSRQLIRETNPGAVFVELDMKRLTRAYKNSTRSRSLG